MDENEDDDLGDDYDCYISSPRERHIYQLNYWNLRYTSEPDLVRFAYDCYAIPAMSDECERIFSSAKILISDRRSRMLPDIIEANECLRSCYTSLADDDDNSKEGYARERGRYWSDTETESEEVATDEPSSESEEQDPISE